MKEELQDKLVEILTAIQSAAGQAKDFTLAQLPDIAQSYVMYGRALESFQSLFLLLLVLTGVVLLFKSIRYARSEGSDEDGAFFAFLGSTALIVGGGVGFMGNVGQLLLVWLAPNVWLLKEIAGLIK